MASTVSFSVDSPRGPRTVSVAYERTGSGEPLLLLHGIGHHHQAWDPVLPVLAPERDVIAVDLPGFGVSPALPDGVPYDLGSVVPVLGAFCEALGVDRPHVAGNSLGGLLALELGREKLVRSVTALSPMRLLDAERATLRVRNATGHATGRTGHADALDRRALAERGRACGADEHHLRATRPPFTRGGRLGDRRPARGVRIPRDARRRTECRVHRRCAGAAGDCRLGQSRPSAAAPARGSEPSTPSSVPGWCGCPAAGTCR